MTEKPIISFRIRADIKDALQKLAEQDRRSLSQYIENALEDHVAAKQQEGKIQR
jgi:predicted transcriptional regulator